MAKATKPRLKYPDTRLSQMSRAQLVDALGQIVDLWFLDTDGYSVDKELDADHLEFMTRLLERVGLAPGMASAAVVARKARDDRPKVRLIISMHGGTIDHVATDNPDVAVTDVVFTERPEEAAMMEDEFIIQGGELDGELIYTHTGSPRVGDQKTFNAVFKAARARIKACQEKS
jgi:hypothetical protein